MENKLVRKTHKIFQRNKKRIYQSIITRKDQHKILLIVGCQRSGNSMMQNILEKDLNTRCFHEFSELSSNDVLEGIRLNSLELVKKEFSKVKAPFIVLKPLVESQNVPELLDSFDNSRALWMFRNYKGVAASNIKHFGINNGINDLRPIVNQESDNWRSEKVAMHVRDTVTKYFFEDMNPYDAAVLFWYARNSIFFDLDLDKHPKVKMCLYEDFVREPEKHVRNIYQLVGQSYPKADITADVLSNSTKKGRDIELSPEIEQLALGMQARLEKAYRTQSLRD